MARKFEELRARMSPEARARVDARANMLIEEMALKELREALALSQAKIAEALEVNQAAVSKLENRADMLLSTLRDYVHAAGGDLVLLARFPEGDVKLDLGGQKHRAR